jgi:hypothetical protein
MAGRQRGSSYNRNAKEARRHMLEHITDAQALMGSAKQDRAVAVAETALSAGRATPAPAARLHPHASVLDRAEAGYTGVSLQLGPDLPRDPSVTRVPIPLVTATAVVKPATPYSFVHKGITVGAPRHQPWQLSARSCSVVCGRQDIWHLKIKRHEGYALGVHVWVRSSGCES